MRRRFLKFARLAAVAAIGLRPAAAWAADDPLARARQLYNERRFEASVLAAEEARNAERGDAVDLIVARAFLERYRESSSTSDLTTARERLRRLNPDRLNHGERVEYLVGLGEHLFLEGDAGAAANIFDSVLTSPYALTLPARERVLDWWASAVDRDARPRSELDRHPIYDRILERMREELAANPGSAVAPYWLAASASGRGDHQAAWDAILAGWVRAALTPDHGASLRGELDRLMQRMVVPQRARALAQPPESVQQEWDNFKVKWAR